MSKIVRPAVATAAAMLCVLLSPEPAAAAGAGEVAHNFLGIGHKVATLAYGPVIALGGVFFLVNRRYTELAVYFIAALFVGALVYSPDAIASAARAIGREVFG